MHPLPLRANQRGKMRTPTKNPPNPHGVSCTHEKHLEERDTLPFMVSGHSVQFKYALYKGIRPARKPDKTIHMNNWDRLFWKFEGASIICNRHSLELWLDVGQRSTFKEVSDYAIEREKEIIADFAEWQRFFPILIKHPNSLNSSRLHVVLHDKRLVPILAPEVDKPTSKKVGLVVDKTPGDAPEFQGPDSVEAGEGVDWLFLRAPHVLKAQNEALKNLTENLNTIIGLMQGGPVKPRGPEGPGSEFR
jgi:hypothetical protein